ncbi:MAG: hypothetical protein WA484_16060 [Solirubrobacteraceae bacterium]
MSQVTSLNGEFTFAELRARTAGLSDLPRAATFHALPDEMQDAAWRELRREVEAREHTGRAEVVA